MFPTCEQNISITSVKKITEKSTHGGLFPARRLSSIAFLSAAKRQKVSNATVGRSSMPHTVIGSVNGRAERVGVRPLFFVEPLSLPAITVVVGKEDSEKTVGEGDCERLEGRRRDVFALGRALSLKLVAAGASSLGGVDSMRKGASAVPSSRVRLLAPHRPLDDAFAALVLIGDMFRVGPDTSRIACMGK